jgi:hypothetical protein
VGLDLGLPSPIAKRPLGNAQQAGRFFDPKVISEVLVHFCVRAPR